MRVQTSAAELTRILPSRFVRTFILAAVHRCRGSQRKHIPTADRSSNIHWISVVSYVLPRSLPLTASAARSANIYLPRLAARTYIGLSLIICAFGLLRVVLVRRTRFDVRGLFMAVGRRFRSSPRHVVPLRWKRKPIAHAPELSVVSYVCLVILAAAHRFRGSQRQHIPSAGRSSNIHWIDYNYMRVQTSAAELTRILPSRFICTFILAAVYRCCGSQRKHLPSADRGSNTHWIERYTFEDCSRFVRASTFAAAYRLRGSQRKHILSAARSYNIHWIESYYMCVQTSAAELTRILPSRFVCIVILAAAYRFRDSQRQPIHKRLLLISHIRPQKF